MSFLAAAAALGAAYLQSRSDKSSSARQIDFQRQMSNTSHQREVADLYAAGLNPILSSKYGGASTPPGAMSNTTSSIIGSAVSSSLQAKRLNEELKLLKSQENLNWEEATLRRADIQKRTKEYDVLKEQEKNAREQRKIITNSAKALDYNLEGLKNEAKIDKTRYGETMRYIKRFVDSISPFTNLRDFKLNN